jgi:ABC-2 type transport system permease protein
VRWLLVKDLQILRRSPLLVGVLVVYPIAIALMIGFALSSPPARPTVALYSGVPTGRGHIHFGSQQIDVAKYAEELFATVKPLRVASPAAATAAVRDGRAQAALIIPADITHQIQSLLQNGVGNPTVRLVLNSTDPLERQFVQEAIDSRVAEVEQAVSKQVLRVAVSDLQQVLNGGSVTLLGARVPLLGLRNARTIVEGALQALPRGSDLAPALRQVVSFADLAIEGLAFAGPALGSIGQPLTVDQSQLAGRTTPTTAYAVAIAAVVSLMFVTVLLAAGLLALERSENAYARLVRGLVRPGALLAEKVALAAACAAVVTLGMSAGVSVFVHLDWSRFALWVLALGCAGLAFAGLGVAIGALAREVSAASLLAFLLSLPIAFIALIPANAVSGVLAHVLSVVSFAFPFRAGLQATGNAFSASSPGIVLPLAHLLGLAVAFGGLARLGLRRFAAV